jgi:hypothetical protein
VRVRSVIDVKVDAQGRGLGQDVVDLRFELGGKCIAAVAVLVLVGVVHAQLLKLQKCGLLLRVCEPASLNQIHQRDGHDAQVLQLY